MCDWICRFRFLNEIQYTSRIDKIAKLSCSGMELSCPHLYAGAVSRCKTAPELRASMSALPHTFPISGRVASPNSRDVENFKAFPYF